VGLLSRDFLKLVGLAFVVAVPVAYWAMSQWLQGFAYRIDLGAGVFLLAGGLALTVALLTVSYQALRAARTDPVNALQSG
jgi:putative ABC transport system permease protein